MRNNSEPFNRVFDVIVVGSGHAGYAATVHLCAQGRSVLLIGPSGDLVWESGRGFFPQAGASGNEHWRALAEGVERRGAVSGAWMDGAITEVVATEQLLASGATVLYYARPVAVERDGDGMVAAILATKTGVRRVAGRQWVDATESGELMRLLTPELQVRAPRRTQATIMLQHADWSKVSNSEMLKPTAWPTERQLTIDTNHGDAQWRDKVLESLEDLEEALGADTADVSMSHLTIDPVSSYDPQPPEKNIGPANVVSASPAVSWASVETLADRFMLGVDAAATLASCAVEAVPDTIFSRPIPQIEPTATLRADVCVAGAGTGGVFAALASAAAGLDVLCFDLLTFVGGIGTGGGVHAYYFGVTGGLQQQVDRDVRNLMKRFKGGPLGDGPFNPWAKMLVLEQLLRKNAIGLQLSALVYEVEKSGDTVTAAMVATADGAVRIEAKAFIDGTGDGDLSAMAGAEFDYGRERDGQSSSYSQSAGGLQDLRGRPRMKVVNFDAGFCDPTDPEDITRARLVGVRQYLLAEYENFTRPTYIAPALGLRQGRQILTEYVLTLDDQIRRRRFADAVGFTGAHYDTHASDYEFESDESIFWVWVNRQWETQIASEISYRMLVPRGLGNVWVASRCLGVSQDAHYATRMQRDMQRVGEVAGFAAAVAIASGEPAQRLPYAELRAYLEKTGALTDPGRILDTEFPSAEFGDMLSDDALVNTEAEASLTKALASLDRGDTGDGIWWLYRHEATARDAVLERITHPDERNPMASWLAAGIGAMWHEHVAEPRLIEAINSREYGFGEAYPEGRYRGASLNPLEWSKVAPNWLCAIALLRRCGTDRCLPALERLLALPAHGINTLTSVAITLEQLVRTGALSDNSLPLVRRLLERTLSVQILGAVDLTGNRRNAGRNSEVALHGKLPSSGMPSEDMKSLPTVTPNPVDLNAKEDTTWQLHLAVARVFRALALPVHHEALQYLHDDRVLVRRKFAELSESTEREPSQVTEILFVRT